MRYLVILPALIAATVGILWATVPSHLRHLASDWSAGPFSDTQAIPTTAWSATLIDAARSQVGVTRGYDGSYRSIPYPGGDFDRSTGVCTDVLVRALRDSHNIDLQKAVHLDMKANFSKYPNNWGLTGPDRNIDHRRVPNLRMWMRRQGYALPLSSAPGAYLPGDIVTWDLGRGQPHIGIVSDRASQSGVPLIIHNAGLGTRENDLLFRHEITGHYRIDPSSL